MDRKFIDEYEHGGLKLRQAIQGLQREDLLAFPVAGTWSIQQIVLHLADTEGVLTDRMKRIIAEERPTLLSFDETRWTSHLHYHDQSAEDAAALLELMRRQMARVLRALPDDAFDRQGIHNEAGPQRLGEIVRKAASHLDHHLKFIVDKREMLGKAMW